VHGIDLSPDMVAELRTKPGTDDIVSFGCTLGRGPIACAQRGHGAGCRHRGGASGPPRFMIGQAVYTAAFLLSWVSAPLALALCGLMALYYAFDQASVPAEPEPGDQQPPDGRSSW